MPDKSGHMHHTLTHALVDNPQLDLHQTWEGMVIHFAAAVRPVPQKSAYIVVNPILTMPLTVMPQALPGIPNVTPLSPAKGDRSPLIQMAPPRVFVSTSMGAALSPGPIITPTTAPSVLLPSMERFSALAAEWETGSPPHIQQRASGKLSMLHF